MQDSCRMNREIDAALLLFEETAKFFEAPAVDNIQRMETQFFPMLL